MPPASIPRIRLGLDLVDVEGVAAAVRAHGDRYLHRVYTAEEIAQCGGEAAPEPTRLAARYAAKEAAFKALPADDVLRFQEVEVVGGGSSAPRLVLHGETARRAADAGIVELGISLTHEGGMACAVALAMAIDSEGGIAS